jgi:hypothetical protein
MSPRKVFSDSTGKHVEKQHTLPLDKVMEPAPGIEEPCSDCNAHPFEPCFSIVDASKVYERMHAARIKAAAARSKQP